MNPIGTPMSKFGFALKSRNDQCIGERCPFSPVCKQ